MSVRAELISPSHLSSLSLRQATRSWRRGASWLMSAACLIASVSGCSFEEPPELSTQEGDLGQVLPDMPVGRDGGGGDLDALDLGPGDPDLTPPVDLGPADMPGEDGDMAPLDLGTPDATMDMPADLSPGDMDTPDLPTILPGQLGSSCQDDTSCDEGTCRDVPGSKVCALACVQGSCNRVGFNCLNNVCVPQDFCAPDGVSGPGCATCDKCAAVGSSCNEIIGGNGELITQCMCESGFYGDGLTCVDRNECQDGSASCDPNATCNNTQGGYSCLCKEGYVGDGAACEPAASVCDMCDTHATCVMLQGSETCRCNPGWAGNGVTCQDIDECLSTTHTCSSKEVCVNTMGGFTCDCAPGYRRNNGQCVDIDECAADPCDPLATCNNTAGGYTCSCPSGVAGNGVLCQPYGSCAEIKTAYPNSQSGTYWIKTGNGTQLQVHCDMVTDGGVGYTFHRVNAASLQTTQQAYASACSSLGMEIVTPRTEGHMRSLTAWNNGSPPNIINVFPTTTNARGAGQWQGICEGMPCAAFINGRENTRCRTLAIINNSKRTWSSGELARSCQGYLHDAGVRDTSGRYEIDPDGGGPLAPFITFCEMALDNGGWTLGATSSDDNQNTWTWNNRALWTNQTVFGSINFANRDYKNAAVFGLRMKDLLFTHYPSGVWAAYGNVGNNSGALSDVLGAATAPQCDTMAGYPMTAGNLPNTSPLCTTDLYFHPGDYDYTNLMFGDERCRNYSTVANPYRDESTWGPAWSMSRDHGCPFDDPGYTSWGANFWRPDEEANGRGFAEELGLNQASAGQGLNFLSIFMRESAPLEPSGQNTLTERLVLEAGPDVSEAGPACPHGSWEDRGDVVLEQGWVICAVND